MKVFGSWKNINSALLLCCMLTPALGQVPTTRENTRTKEVVNALAKLKSGDFDGYHVGVIGSARATEAIPDLERQFTVISDPLDKAKIAQVLLSFGVRNEIYWDYLANLANTVLDSNAPDPVQYDENRRQAKGISKQFVRWAEAQGIPAREAGENAIYVWPGYFMLLGASHDSRAIPLLRKALNSHNSIVQSAAAMSLAELQDESSIPLIIARCKVAPPQLASSIAQALVFFDNPQAQAAVDKFVEKQMAGALREAKNKGRKALQ